MTLNRRDFIKTLGAVAGGAAVVAAGIRTTVGVAREYDKAVREVADALPVPLAEDTSGVWVEIDGQHVDVSQWTIERDTADTKSFGEAWREYNSRLQSWSGHFTVDPQDIKKVARSSGACTFVLGKREGAFRGMAYITEWPLPKMGETFAITGSGPLTWEPA